MKKVHIGAIFAVCVVMASAVSQVFAVGYDEQFYAGNSIFYYDPRTGECVAKEVTGIEVESGENLETLLNFFVGKGFSLAAAAGIAGNIKVESAGTFSGAIIQGGEMAKDNVDIMSLKYDSGAHKGFGIAQWTSPGRKQNLIKFAASQGAKITDLNMQLGFMWQEMSDPTYKTMMTKLNENKDNPIAAAAVFHGNTPNITAEGAGIDPVFATSGAAYGFERSGDTSQAVIKNRGGYAKGVYDKYQGKIQDGNGVTIAEPSEIAVTEASSAVCNLSTEGTTNLGVGSGDFKDSGEVQGYANVLFNAQDSERVYGSRLVNKGACAAITSRVWHGNNTAYGYNHAIQLWNAYKNTPKGHKDREPKKGAILLYDTGKVSGHVVIYLGNNKILNDGHIDNADFPEKKWGNTYLGWVDPNDIGWKSVKATNTAGMEGWLKSYGLL